MQPKRKIYTRPNYQPRTYTDEDGAETKLLDFFARRGISKAVVERNRIEVREAWIPAKDRKERALAFPYLRNGEVVNVQYRTADKYFSLEKDAELILYGIDDIQAGQPLIFVEGQCFPGECEILTKKGWVRFDEYDGEDVAQVTAELKSAFVTPTQIVKKHYCGELLRYETGGNYSSITTPDHSLVYRQNGMLHKRRADNMPSALNLGTIPTAVEMDGVGIDLSNDQIALCLAISADGSIRQISQGYKSRYVVFGFKRQRKILRLRGLLERLGITASDTGIAGGYTSICFHLPDWATERLLPNNWLEVASLRQRKFILDEMVYWDGNFVKGRNQTEYASKHLHNAKWMQTMAHTAGMMSTVMLRRKELGDVYKVSILHTKKWITWQKMKKTLVPHDGDVFCVTVPSGMILVRQEGRISVSGNCDKLALEEAGFLNAVSVPNGAKNINGEWIESAKEKLDSASYFILAGDNDEPGKECQIELSRRLGVEKCWRVEWPDGCKDANDVLVKLGVEALQNAVNTATPLPINGVIEISDLWPEIERMYFDGLTGGVDVGWENLSQIYKPRLGEFTVLTGAPNTGKSSMLDAMLVNIALLHGWKMAIYSPEQQPLALHAANLIRIEKGLPFRVGMNERMTLEQAKTSAFRISEYFKLLSPDEEELTVEGIIRLAKACVTRYGIKGLVIDPWNELEHARPSNQTETEFIAESLRKLRRFARLYQIHLWIIVHPTKQQKDKEGVYPVVTPYDLMGSSHWYNKADMILSLWRDSLLPDAPLTVHSQKVRFQENGRLGEANLYYDSPTGRLSDRAWNNRQSWEDAPVILAQQEELSTNNNDMPEF